MTYISLGKYFGYPDCCCNYFSIKLKMGHKENDEENRKHYGTPWDGTGFLPCPACRPRALADFDRFVAEVITPNRLHHEPFPEDGY